MNQRELITDIADMTGIPISTVEKVMKRLVVTVKTQLQYGNEVTLHSDLGKLKPAQSAARQGRNPATGEAIAIPAKRTVKFKAAKSLKEAVN